VALPLKYHRALYSSPYNTWPGAAPSGAECLDDYDDIDEAPWALRFGPDPNVPPEPVVSRMVACVKLSAAELDACLASINTSLPLEDVVSVALVNGYVFVPVFTC
jgi:hypothetical protein